MPEDSDGLPVHIRGATAEAVAYALLQDVLGARRISESVKGRHDWLPSRDWLLTHFVECLSVVRNGIVVERPVAAQHEPLRRE